jgi:thiol-disulfide isomerase/thioredoxin
MARADGRHGRRRAPAVVVAVAVAALAGCGGSTDAGGAVGGGSGTASSASPGGGPATTSEAGAAGEWLRTYRGTTVDGKPFDGASLAGKPTVLWFWAPWCPTCLGQAPGVRTAVEQSSGEVNVVGVAGLDTAGAMPDFVRLAKVGSTAHVSDEAGEVWKRFGVTEQSVFVFLDASGAETFRGRLSAADIPARVAALAT